MGISVTWPTVFFWWAQLKMAAWHLENTVGVVTLKEKQNKNTKKHKKKVVPKIAFCALSLSDDGPARCAQISLFLVIYETRSFLALVFHSATSFSVLS